MMEKLEKAIENNVPKIKRRTLPHPEISEDIKEIMKEAKKVKVLMTNGTEYLTNKRKLSRLRETIREHWEEKIHTERESRKL